MPAVGVLAVATQSGVDPLSIISTTVAGAFLVTFILGWVVAKPTLDRWIAENDRKAAIIEQLRRQIEDSNNAHAAALEERIMPLIARNQVFLEQVGTALLRTEVRIRREGDD